MNRSMNKPDIDEGVRTRESIPPRGTGSEDNRGHRPSEGSGVVEGSGAGAGGGGNAEDFDDDNVGGGGDRAPVPGSEPEQPSSGQASPGRQDRSEAAP